ncbi:MAG: efflux RND transporter periplasmic adaptor subunit [Bacteroidetes bacterium]|nr:efflux RND transporter periplasmic adaptor subunit [Bacteroidota bacterium]
MKIMNRWRCRLPGAIALMLAVGGCSRQEQAGEEKTPPPMVTVKIAGIQQGDAVSVVNAVGKIEALRTEKLYAPVAGTVLSLKVVEGESVGNGAVVAVIRTKESQAQINGANALLAAARTPEEKAEAQRMLQLAASADNSAQVRAPIGGIVATKNANQGESVAEGAEMFSIVDLSTLVFVADLPLSAIARVRLGSACRIRLQALPDEELEAIVAAISPQSDAQSQTVRVRLRFNHLPTSTFSLLKTDMAGTASIVTGHHPEAMLVPKKAVLRNDEDNTNSVVIVGADSLAHIVPVELGSARDSIVEIRSDRLHAGMQVIVEGHYSLADSTHVTVAR